MQHNMTRPPAKRRGFNMVEVALATAIIGIGFVSIMALFPIGLNTSRDAMAEGYAAEIGDQIINLEEAYSHYPGYFKKIPNLAALNAIMPPVPGIVMNDLTTDPVDGTVLTATDSERWYRIQRYTDTNANGSLDANEPVDCDVLVHATFAAGNPQIPKPDGTATIALPAGTSALLKVEVRWPSFRPDTNRQSVVFIKQIFQGY